MGSLPGSSWQEAGVHGLGTGSRNEDQVIVRDGPSPLAYGFQLHEGSKVRRSMMEYANPGLFRATSIDLPCGRICRSCDQKRMFQMIRVTCALIESDGRLLCARRSPTMSHPGKWEFPGGKIEGRQTEG